MDKRNQGPVARFFNGIPHYVWIIISLTTAIILWILISNSEAGKMIFATPAAVWNKFITKLGTSGPRGLWLNLGYSLFRVLVGFLCGFFISIPVAFAMGWYAPVRNLVEPWIQFLRNIPPLAYLSLVVVGAGVGEKAKIIVIFIASFLILVVSIYQGVVGVDATLIKAARVLGASDRDIFFKVVIPASTPFILVGTRIGLAASLTTLIASELTGSTYGLGVMIIQAQGEFDMATVLLGILIIGIIGTIFDRIVRYLERRLTGWQETMPQ